jgi:hypothetical protein
MKASMYSKNTKSFWVLIAGISATITLCVAFVCHWGTTADGVYICDLHSYLDGKEYRVVIQSGKLYSRLLNGSGTSQDREIGTINRSGWNEYVISTSWASYRVSKGAFGLYIHDVDMARLGIRHPSIGCDYIYCWSL